MEPAFYKHYVPTGRETCARKILLRKENKKLDPCIAGFDLLKHSVTLKLFG